MGFCAARRHTATSYFARNGASSKDGKQRTKTNDGWPVSLEVQGYVGEAGSLFVVRGGKISGAKRRPFVKDRPSFGSWNEYEITSRDGDICLQSEGWPVYHRNVMVKELK